MGFWHVKARDLKSGDEIRALPGLLDTGFLRVRDVDTGGASERVAVLVQWVHGRDSGTWWEDFAPDESLTVRR